MTTQTKINLTTKELKKMTSQQELLVRILACSDAIFLPMRRVDWDSTSPSIFWEYRTRFPTFGIPWSTGEGNETERKARQRTLKNLSTDGLLDIFSQRRRVGVCLTEQGDIYTRGLIGLPHGDYAHGLLCRIIAMEAVADGLGPMVSELMLAGIANYTGDYELRLSVLEDEILPCLVRNWVESRSDRYGRTYYSATSLGRTIAKQPTPIMPDNLPAFNKEAWDLYFSERRSFREKLRSQKPDRTSEIGFCPLPVSLNLHPRKPLEETADAAN
jgi:hypothetical protein